jgi:hypothetical protein
MFPSAIVGLPSLAPSAQEELLFLDETTGGREPMTERSLRPLLAEDDWARQTALWKSLTARPGS